MWLSLAPRHVTLKRVNEMKRLRWLLISVIPLLFVSCDRKTVAHVFLNLGFNASMDRNPTSATDDTAAIEPARRAPRSVRTLEVAVGKMRQLQDLSVSAGHPRCDELTDVIEQITALTDSLAREEAAKETETAALAEIKWLALAAGTEIFPDTYGAALSRCQDRLFGGPTTATKAANDSAKRFIREYLVKQGSRDEAVRTLSLHSLAYPNCEMNVDFYITVFEQLANQGQIQAAVSIAKQGLERCVEHSDVKLLSQQLERVYVENQGAPGVPMNFAGPLIDGKRFGVTSTRGGPVLVVFWASWCAACREELPVIRELYERYRGEGLQVVGISLDSDRSALTQYVGENNLNWPHVFADQPQQLGWDNPIAKYYSVTSIPRAFLLDPEGIVVAADLKGDFEIETAVLDQLAQ